MGDQARSQVLLDLSRLEADPDGSYQELAPNWLEHASALLERAGAQGDAAQVLEALKLIFHPTIEQGLAIRLLLRWIRVCVVTYLPPQWWRVCAATVP